MARGAGRLRWRRLYRVPAPISARPGKPGLEGFLGREYALGWHARKAADSAGGGAGVCVRREVPHLAAAARLRRYSDRGKTQARSIRNGPPHREEFLAAQEKLLRHGPGR